MPSTKQRIAARRNIKKNRNRRQEKAHCRSPAQGDTHWAGAEGRQSRTSQTEMKSASLKREPRRPFARCFVTVTTPTPTP